jgi:hypothetical protein
MLLLVQNYVRINLFKSFMQFGASVRKYNDLLDLYLADNYVVLYV